MGMPLVALRVHDGVMAGRDRVRRWVVAFAAGMLVTGLGAFLAVQGLDRADKWASVFGLFVGLAGLGLAVAGVVDARQRGSRQIARQSVSGSTVGGGVTQVHGVNGSLRIGSTAVPTAPPSSASPSSSPAKSADGSDGIAQLLDRSWTAGPVRQIGDVGGDVDIDR